MKTQLFESASFPYRRPKTQFFENDVTCGLPMLSKNMRLRRFLRFNVDEMDHVKTCV